MSKHFLLSHWQNRARRAVDFLVRQGWISPRHLGYRHLASVSMFDHCRARKCPYVVHSPEQILSLPLPSNIKSRNLLNRNCGRYERSFFEVPDLQVQACYSATVHNCRIVKSRSEWGDDFYAIVTDADEILRVTGTEFRADFAATLRQNTPDRSIDKVAWITTHSTKNHYMWLYTHLPRLMFAEKIGVAEQILFPAKDLLSNVKHDCLSRLGYCNAKHFDPYHSMIHVDKLTILEIDSFDPWALATLRQRLVTEQQPHKRSYIYISRAKCHYRKLANEDQVWPLLRDVGFHKVFLEDMPLAEQIETLSGAEIVLGVHGAGFANILFCQPGTRVIEIQDPDDPNPHFYALASLLGLKYSLIISEVDGNQESHYRDLTVKPANLLQEIRRELRP